MGKIVLGKVAFTPRGEYDGSHVYERYDMVYHEVMIYVSLKDGNQSALDDRTAWIEYFGNEVLREMVYKSQHVEWEMLDEELQNIILSIQTGGIALATDWGNDERIGITQKKLSEEHESVWSAINSIINDKATVSLTVTPSVVHVGSTNTITLKATTDTEATEIKITGGASVITGSGKSVQGTDTVQLSAGEKTYTAEFTINGLKKSTTAKLTAVNKIYYGSGDVYTEATSVASARKTPAGTYNVTVGTSGKSIFFVIPATMTINKATLSGFDFPLDAPVSVEKDNVSYKSYKSSNTMDAGTYQIVIS